jgi:hypothetical protein
MDLAKVPLRRCMAAICTFLHGLTCDSTERTMPLVDEGVPRLLVSLFIPFFRLQSVRFSGASEPA